MYILNYSHFIGSFAEISLIGIIMLMQILACFFQDHAKKISLISILLLSICMIYYQTLLPHDYVWLFNDNFIVNQEFAAIKLVMFIFAIITIVLYHAYIGYYKNQYKFKFEFITLIILSTAGAFIVISATNFLTLFCALELQSICAYSLCAFNNKSVKSSEAALKYFILGSLMSVIMLFGISFLYGFTGSVRFNDIASIFNNNTNIALTFGMIMVFISLLFKLSAAPFHFWTPDIYEGAPIYSVNFFNSVHKISTVTAIINILTIVTKDNIIIYNLFYYSAILSLFIGAVGGLNQYSIKRLLGYSSILNIGFILAIIVVDYHKLYHIILLYIILYSISISGLLAMLINIFKSKIESSNFDDLKQIKYLSKKHCLLITLIILSVMGMPPFAGFFAKYYVIYHVILYKQFSLTVLIIISTVISCFYYLKIIKNIYFNIDSDLGNDINPTIKSNKKFIYNKRLLVISYLSIFVVIFFGALFLFLY